MEKINQSNKPKKFHVYIIESPSAPDLYLKRFEGETLSKTLSLSGISSSHRLAVNKEAFTAAFGIGLKEYFESSNIPPVIHISAHGSSDGIMLTSGEIIKWDELKQYLIPVNKKFNEKLLVCMSSCEGVFGCRMAMKDDNRPFLGIVGSGKKPTWSETNIAFSTFYHLFKKGIPIMDAVKIMNLASGDDGFVVISAKEARDAYLNDINTKNSNTYKTNKGPNQLEKKIEDKLSLTQ